MTEPTPFSVTLRTQTRESHANAEHAAYMETLLAGDLSLAAWTDLVVQNHAIYTHLEAAGRRLADDPVVRPFLLDELLRTRSLEADLEALLGDDWLAQAENRLTPAVSRYVERIDRLDSASGFLAHHYVRYLGDLSGGQVIRSRVPQIYGDDGERSTSFYTFSGIPRIKPFRDRYRVLLDEAPLSGAQQQALIAEANVVFALNQDVFADLAGRHLRPAA